MKVVSIVGARPQFIKAAAVSRVLREQHTEILVHTGQHYDDEMSAIFFRDLEIPEPEYNLGVGSGSHGWQTAQMLQGIEEILLDERPDWVLVYGDTNSTLAGALAAVKLHIPVAHVEAGLRSFNSRMPEEINRVLTDHASTLLLCPSQTAVDNLANEGITAGVHLVGDVMSDALAFAAERALKRSTILEKLGLDEKHYLVATVHRAENTDDPVRLHAILNAFNALDEPVVFPTHPRTRNAMQRMDYTPASHIRLIDPLGYLDMVRLMQAARMILTDSGGIQKEAYWLKVPCVTLRDETEWVETVEAEWNVLVGADRDLIVSFVSAYDIPKDHPKLYGSGQAVFQCLKVLRLI
jgi:UDP-N-acetylglucosamine 2-epimerase